MRIKTILLTLIFTLTFTVMAQEASNIYDIKVVTRQKQEITLGEYKGKVLLIVNTATKCGFTPQYTELEELYKQYREQGLEILDFPCNQFGNQAPGTEEEIHEFCQLNYGTEFPQFRKIEVNGENQHPLFAYLKAQKGFEGFDLNHPIGKILDEMLGKQNPDYAASADIKWNFTKFLVDREGKVVARFEPTAPIADVEAAIKALL
ncbi:MAG: glutathione peroxidase [Muribaculaceae bacterium]|nr:glutathione peroxidase [Muribaculaceae bacterium]